MSHRRPGRHAGRRAAGNRHHCNRCNVAADHLRAAAGRRPDHARRHLLRCAIWRLDNVHPGQHPGRGDLGRDDAGRLPDGQEGSRRSGAGDCCDRLIHRGLRCDRPDRSSGHAIDKAGAGVRPGRIFFADGPRPDLRGGAREGECLEGGRDDCFWNTAIDGRLRYRNRRLADGLGFATVAMGVFGFAEIIRNLDAGAEMDRDLVQQKITGLMPTKKDMKDSAPAVLRGTVLGSILGILPGGGAVIASFAAYTLEKKLAKNPSRFGRGAVEGVAAPESANNAAAQTSFIPLLTLGIPPNAVMALMVGAMTIHGIVPGPQVMQKQPELVWGMIASMWLGNLMLIIINLPLVGIWVRLLRVAHRLMFPCIVIFCSIGIYSVNNAPVDVILAGVFGLVGYWLIKHDFEPAPLLLGMVLGPLMEENLRRALLISR